MFIFAISGELGDNVLFPAPIAEPKMVVFGIGQRLPFDKVIIFHKSRVNLNGKTKKVNSNFIWIWALRRQSLIRTSVLIVSAFLFELSTIKLSTISTFLYAFYFLWLCFLSLPLPFIFCVCLALPCLVLCVSCVLCLALCVCVCVCVCVS